jgi:hypothetical protein
MPFLAYGPYNSFLFGTYGNSLKFLEGESHVKQDAELKNVFIAGTIGKRNPNLLSNE